MGYNHEMVPKSKDWVERLNLYSKLLNFNTGRIIVLESQAVNESLKPTETSITPESSKDSEAECLTPLPPLKNIQGASPSLEVMPFTFQPYSPKERSGLGYSFVLKAFRVFNTRRQQVEKTYHVTFDESMEAIRFTNTSVDEIRIDDSFRYHPSEFIYEDDLSRQYQANYGISYDLGKCMLTRGMAAKLTAASASECLFADFLSKIEPKKVSKALKHPGWVDVMQEELNQFYRNKVWTLVLLPYGKTTIGSKQVFNLCTSSKDGSHQGFDLKGYSDIDYDGCNMDKKSTSGACQILGGKLVYWSVNKRQSVAIYPNPPTDDFEVCPLKDYTIKFSVINGKNRLTLDFKTFMESTRLDYAKDAYVSPPSPKGTTTDPKDSEGNVQPVNKVLPSKVFDEGAVKTMLFPKGLRREKDLERLKPPANMEPQTNPVADLSGTKSDEEEVFADGDDMEEDTQADKEEHQSLSPNKDKPEPSYIPVTQVSNSDSLSPDLEKYDNTLSLTERQLVKASIEGYYEENVDHREKTDKVINAAMNSLDKNSIARGDLLNALNGVTETLKAIQDAIKEDYVLKKKVIEDSEAYTKNSTYLTELLILIKNFDFQGFKSLVESLQAIALSKKTLS
ncbi:retrovirus-related pol polyprotein from transposon TNT 1-94 [Tanacetum coccineum]